MSLLCPSCHQLPIWCRCTTCRECRRPFHPERQNRTGFCSWDCFDAEPRPNAPEGLLAFLPAGTVMRRIDTEEQP